MCEYCKEFEYFDRACYACSCWPAAFTSTSPVASSPRCVSAKDSLATAPPRRASSLRSASSSRACCFSSRRRAPSARALRVALGAPRPARRKRRSPRVGERSSISTPRSTARVKASTPSGSFRASRSRRVRLPTCSTSSRLAPSNSSIFCGKSAGFRAPTTSTTKTPWAGERKA